MDAKDIAQLGKKLVEFLRHFRDCFGRSEPRQHLHNYVCGQVSGLHRKSVEPMALMTGTPPRTLQRFLESVEWDEERLRDRIQELVVQEHSDPQAIGLIDESSHPKQGRHTAAVHRQWCGNQGKIDNCVVSVHLGYIAGTFQCILDSELFLPEAWANDPERRRQAHIPEEVVYRKKTEIALGQVRRAVGNGVRVAAYTFDEGYTRDGQFLDGLDELGQQYVGEAPANFTGWLRAPRVVQRPRAQEVRSQGQTQRFARVAVQSAHTCEVQNLVCYSPIFQRQRWHRFRIKDGKKGPMVWEVKHAAFWRKRQDGLPTRCTLIVARNLLAAEVKYFVSNMPLGQGGVSLEWLLWAAFSRWPMEQCFRQAKDELGMSHFEVRGWQSIHRHFYITQLSHLFCSRVHELAKKNSRDHRGAGTRGRVGLVRCPWPARSSASGSIREQGSATRLPAAARRYRKPLPHQTHASAPSEDGHQPRQIATLHPS
jgi:SRSO17 transposase